MTNPFATFRKNQKSWMAALVLLAILAFVVAPVFDYMSQAISGGGPSNEVVVRWDGGQLTVSEVQLAAQTHSSMVRFFSEVAQQVVEAGGQPNVPGFQLDPTSRQIFGLGIQASSNPADICQTRILAAKAKRLGVAFDDNAVDEFIMAYTDGKLSTPQLESILAEASGGNLSYFEVRELLKDELSAMIVQQTALAGMLADVQRQPTPIASPGATFDNFLKLNRTAKVEAFPVFVDDYLNDVSDSPSQEEIQAIYDKGSLLPSNPDSPNPGFIRRYKTNLEYIEANMQQWIDREKEKLTEEELRAEYEQRVSLGQLQVPVDTPQDTSTQGADGGATEEKTQRPPSPNTTRVGEESAEQAAEESADKASAAEKATPAAEQPSQQEAVGDAEATTSEEPAAADESSSLELAPQPESSDQSSRATPRQHLVAYTQENSSEQSSNVPPPVVQPPALSPANTDAQANSAADENPAQEATAGEADAEDAAMRTQTFEEARDMIADSMARDVAITALDDALNDLFDNTMRPYYFKYRQYNALANNQELKDAVKDQDPPPKPDLQKLAEEMGFVYGSTGLVDRAALATTPFGQGMIRPDESGLNGRVGEIATNGSLDLFRPIRSTYFDQAALMQGGMPEFIQYLLWKTEEREAYIPELDEVREEVVEAWKRDKARALAESAARDLAEKVGTGDQAWDEALSDAEKALIVSTDPFTWMNRMGDFITESPVPKLDRVGADFMRTVFGTPTGQVAVAPNAPQNVYYVFRMIDVQPPQEELQDRFNADPVKAGPKQIASSQTQDLLRGWFARVEEEMDVQWQMNLQQL